MTEYFIKDVIDNFEGTEFVESKFILDSTDREEEVLIREEELKKYGLSCRKTRKKFN